MAIVIKDKFVGCVLHCAAPSFKRNVADASTFVLDNNLSAQELAYVHEVTNGEMTYDNTAE